MKIKINKNIVITGIIAITVIELYALSQGINGVMMATCIAIIAAAIGVIVPTPKLFNK